MSPKEQNTAIAESCGWIVHSDGPTDHAAVGLRKGYHEPDDAPVAIPDFCNDLNAMHEAEKCLRGYELMRYISALIAIRCDDTGVLVTTPAEERAEAFLRAIGKWSPSPTQGGSR